MLFSFFYLIFGAVVFVAAGSYNSPEYEYDQVTDVCAFLAQSMRSAHRAYSSTMRAMDWTALLAPSLTFASLRSIKRLCTLYSVGDHKQEENKNKSMSVSHCTYFASYC